MAKKKEQKSEVIEAIKGFDANWKCRDYQYELGKTFKHDGDVSACSSGFHAVEYPLDVFGYYGPVDNKFAIVECAGEISRHEDDTKIACAEITIKAELKIPEIVSRAVNWILDRVEDAKVETNTGYQSAATNTGDRSAATNTGYQSAATNTGDRSAATNTGDQSAATNTGDRSAATNTGDRSAATNTGDRSAATNTGYQSAATVEGIKSVAAAFGYQSKAKACEGSAIVLIHRNDDMEIVHIRASKVGENGIKPNVFYTLDEAGEFVEAD